MDDETIVEAVDFSEFEALFQMKRFVAKQSRTEVDGEPAYCCTFLVTIVWWCVFTGDTKIVHLDLFDNKRQRGIGQSNILHSTLYFKLHVLIKISIFLSQCLLSDVFCTSLSSYWTLTSTCSQNIASYCCKLFWGPIVHTHTHTHTWLTLTLQGCLRRLN